MFRQRIIGLFIICICFLIPMLHVHVDANELDCGICYTQQQYLQSNLGPNNVSVYVTHSPLVYVQSHITLTHTYSVKRLRGPPSLFAS
jgi:hypothetical protein